MTDDYFSRLSDNINQAIENKFPWVNAVEIDADQVKHAQNEARNFILSQGGNPERSSGFRDCKIKMYPPECKGKVFVELHVNGRLPVSVRGAVQVKMVPGTEQRLQAEMNPMDRKWLTVEIGENLKRHSEIKGTGCQPQSTWTRIDLEIHRQEQFAAAKTQAIEERNIQTARPPVPAFLLQSKQPERERAVMK